MKRKAVATLLLVMGISIFPACGKEVSPVIAEIETETFLPVPESEEEFIETESEEPTEETTSEEVESEEPETETKETETESKEPETAESHRSKQWRKRQRQRAPKA